MDRNKIIILALIAVITVLLIGIVAVMPNMNKMDSNLKFKSNTTLNEGNSLKVKLTDSNGTAIANQNVNVTITDKNKASSYYSVVTDEKGVGKLKLDKSPGKYSVTLNYAGNDAYNACNATKKVTIENEVVEAEPASSATNPDPGAFYSAQAGRVIYTGEVMDMPGGKYGHLGALSKIVMM